MKGEKLVYHFINGHRRVISEPKKGGLCTGEGQCAVRLLRPLKILWRKEIRIDKEKGMKLELNSATLLEPGGLEAIT